MYTTPKGILISLLINCVRSYPGFWSNPALNPVHGLYVKPSADGVTGDLFVAATEDNGVKSQWAVDQPINFLQVADASKPHTHAVAVSYPGFAAPHEESLTQKQAVIPNSLTSLPIQYAYAIPLTPGENNPIATYPYAYPILSQTPETSTPKICDPSATVSPHPFQYPFQFLYPQFMSNAMNILKDAGISEDTASSVMAQASPIWPPASYAYPMYIMVDPSVWTQNQSSTTAPVTTTLPNTQEDEESIHT